MRSISAVRLSISRSSVYTNSNYWNSNEPILLKLGTMIGPTAPAQSHIQQKVSPPESAQIMVSVDK